MHECRSHRSSQKKPELRFFRPVQKQLVVLKCEDRVGRPASGWSGDPRGGRRGRLRPIFIARAKKIAARNTPRVGFCPVLEPCVASRCSRCSSRRRRPSARPWRPPGGRRSFPAGTTSGRRRGRSTPAATARSRPPRPRTPRSHRPPERRGTSSGIARARAHAKPRKRVGPAEEGEGPRDHRRSVQESPRLGRQAGPAHGRPGGREPQDGGQE